MTGSTGYVRSYLAPSEHAPWRWADDGQVLTWQDGGTIAFRQEVERVLARLAHESQIVPPFLSVSVLFAALRSTPRGALADTRREWIAQRIESSDGGPASKQAALSALGELTAVLRILETVPEGFWRTESALEHLAVHVFERCGLAKDAHASALLARTLEHGLPPWSFTTNPETRGGSLESWIEAITLLYHGLARFEASALELRARTGLDAVPEAVSLPIDSHLGARALLESLRNDHELAAIAHLAREIAATLHVPRPVSDPTELPLGGVTDISTRGSLERLLISELAQDDLTLAVRIATNEALYTRREAPRTHDSGARCILVDVGIRSWGTPRVLAAAAALGLAAAADKRDRSLAWRTLGADLTPVDLTTRAGLLELLEALEPDPDPADALRRFVERTSTLGAPLQRFLLVSDAAARSRELRACLDELRETELFVVAVDARGALRVEARTTHGSRAIHASNLDVSGLLAQSRTQAPSGSREPAPVDVAGPLPAFLQQRPMPLGIEIDPIKSWCCLDMSEARAFRLSRRGDVLVQRDNHSRGHVIAVLEDVEHVALFACESGPTPRIHVVHSRARRGPWTWTRVDPTDASCRSDRLHERVDLSSLALVSGHLVLNDPEGICVIADQGDRFESKRIGAYLEHVRGRFFRGATRIFALSVSGGAPVLTEMDVTEEDAARTLAVFERPGKDGPWLLTATPTCVVDTSSGFRSKIQNLDIVTCTALDVARDGKWLFVNGNFFVDLEHSRVDYLNGKLVFVRFWRADPIFGDVRAVGCTAEGELMIVKGSRKCCVPCLDPTKGTRLHLRSVPAGPHRWLPFEGRPGRPDRLKILNMPRETVWFDPRGLLHMQSSDSSLPEVTLALSQHVPVRVWCSDGWTHGDPVPLGPERDARTALELVHAHAKRLG